MGGPEIKILLDALEKEGHEIVYWVGEWPVAHLAPKGALFHDHNDAWDAKRSASLMDAQIPPADAALIGSMYETETLILTMMNKHYDAAPVDERKHIFYTMLSYWNYVLELVQPDAVLFNLVPHSIYSNIVYDMAKRRGIFTYCFEETWIAGRILGYTDFWKGSDEIRAALRDARERGTKVADLHEDLRAYYEWYMDLTKNKTPWYIKEQRSRARGVGVWMHRLKIAAAAPHRALPRLVEIIARTLRPNLRTEYERLTAPPEFDKPFIYFPLSFQPERTTSPQGGIYCDQILAIETLAAALPDGWEIYVKEHPSQWWTRGKTRYSCVRYPGYYKRIASIPRTRLVPFETDTFNLMKHSKTIAAVVGSALWEALMSGRKVILFGIPWYRDCPGVISVRNVEDCKTALGQVQGESMTDKKGIVAFLKALEIVGTRAHLGYAAGATPAISAADSIRALAATACRALSSFASRKPNTQHTSASRGTH
ncbi:MAG: hypothetical protein Q7S08_01020 [bacterium]|nr:hypothetical protein [bacterium]